VEEDLSRGILETIDMDSYRVEKQSTMKIALAETDAEIEPVPTSGGGTKPEPELDLLSNIVKAFHVQWATLAGAAVTGRGHNDRPHRTVTGRLRRHQKHSALRRLRRHRW
jgi:hypothetical protein